MVEDAKEKIADEVSSGDVNVDLQNRLDVLQEQQEKIAEEEEKVAEEKAEEEERELLEAAAEQEVQPDAEAVEEELTPVAMATPATATTTTSDDVSMAVPATETTTAMPVHTETAMPEVVDAALQERAFTPTPEPVKPTTSTEEVTSRLTDDLVTPEETREQEVEDEEEEISDLQVEEERLVALKLQVSEAINNYKSEMLDVLTSTDEITSTQLKTLQLLFKLADRDGDKALDGVELENLMNAVMHSTGESIESSEPAPQGITLAGAPSANFREKQKAMSKLRQKVKVEPQQVKALLDSMDRDHDGFIQFHEFVKGLKQMEGFVTTHGKAFKEVADVADINENKDADEDTKTVEKLQEQVEEMLEQVERELETTKVVEKEEKKEEKRRSSLMTP